MTSDFNSQDVSQLRNYYEAQGAAARMTGDQISCSEPTIVATVLRMAMEYADDFRTVLDVGCGANLDYNHALIQRGKQVVGVDFTWNFLKLAPEESRVPLIQADALHLPFPDASFDAVICSETAEHIPDDRGVVRELARVLHPRGRLFLTVPNLWNAARILEMVKGLNPRINLMPGHLREYSVKKVFRLLVPQFEIQKVYPVEFGWTGPLGGRIDSLIKGGSLTGVSKSIAVAAMKL